MADNNQGESPVNIQEHLEGIDFPASKQDIIQHAKQQDASEHIISLLRQLPERQFHGPTEVSQAFAAIE